MPRSGSNRRTRSGAPRTLHQHEVEAFLRNMSSEDANRLLRSAGHQRMVDERTEDAIGREVERRVRAYFQSAEGRAAVARRQEEEMERRAAAQLESPAAQQALNHAFITLAGRQARDRGTDLDRLCRQAIERQVERWLQSHKGQGAVQALLERALDQKICNYAAARRQSWITMRLAEIEGTHAVQ